MRCTKGKSTRDLRKMYKSLSKDLIKIYSLLSCLDSRNS
jgi:hypothetical protein